MYKCCNVGTVTTIEIEAQICDRRKSTGGASPSLTADLMMVRYAVLAQRRQCFIPYNSARSSFLVCRGKTQQARSAMDTSLWMPSSTL
ncbi:hypothetical protein Pelo_4882 [Pelomyxa schiedti]|nr:hypothetical protein Pelo_4882 [Pelomyxa schiedti]